MRLRINSSIGAVAGLILLVAPSILIATTSADPALTEYYITEGTSSTNNPTDIASGPDGALWFMNNNYESLMRVTTSGSFSGYDTDPLRGQGLTLGSDNHLWTDDSYNSQVAQLNTDGTYTDYHLPTGYQDPRLITSGINNNLWLTYSSVNNNQSYIGQLTTAGAYTTYQLPDYGYAPGSFTTGPDGAMWFTESSGTNYKIGRITSTGVITSYSISLPASYITTGSDGALWFTAAGQIGRITTDGIVSSYAIPSDLSANRITSGPDGALWFTASNVSNSTSAGGSVGRLTTAGSLTRYDLRAGTYPMGITTGSDGALWFTEPGQNRIGRITVPAVATLLQAVNAGGSAAGSFTTDNGFSGGSTYSSSVAVDTTHVNNPAPQAVYQTVRYGNSFNYSFNGLTPNSTYALRLHFNEPYWGTTTANGGGVGSRIFNVAVNGQTALSDFDVYQKAGGSNKAIVEQVTVTADGSGNVTVQFSSVVDNAIVSGLELYSGTLPSEQTPPPVPISTIINAGGSASGSFATDNSYVGGSTYTSTASVDTSGVTNPAPQDVYQSTRYGNFTYDIAGLPAGSQYKVRLHFNEPYWGTTSAGGGTGSRVFDVAINGSPVLNNFDIFQDAGGANKADIQEFTATSDAQGRIVIQFTSVTDNAIVSGIEVTPL